MINVTKAYLPDKTRFDELTDQIWENHWLTNNGPILQSLESRLREFLKVKHFQMVGNGTIALQLAIRALGLRGKIITTPFSYVATLNSIIWENCTPVFADILEDSMTINPELIERLIDDDTVAILATHVYGIPCEVYKIEEIQKKYNLRVIYDAAHSFNTFINGRSVLTFGDISTLSFHATKIYHTIEGGGIVSNNSELDENLFLLKSFGHKADDYYMAGINGKNSEFHAAMGHLVLNDFLQIQDKRKEQHQFYSNLIEDSNLPLIRPRISREVTYNYSYYPIVFPNESSLLKSMAALNKENIFPRRYFYPSLNNLPYIPNKTSCPISEKMSSMILCLPLFHELTKQDQEHIVIIIKNSI